MQNSHKIRTKFAQNSRKNYIIETLKIKKVHAQCENRRTSAATVLYIKQKSLLYQKQTYEGESITNQPNLYPVEIHLFFFDLIAL